MIYNKTTYVAYTYVFDFLLSLQLIIKRGEEIFPLYKSGSNTKGINISACENSTDSYERKSTFKCLIMQETRH